MGLSDARVHPLVGAWELVSAKFEPSDGRPEIEAFGSAPRGLLVFTGGGRMAAMISATDALLLSYSGVYRLEGEDRFITRVDMAWRADWIGSDQLRFWRIEDNVLVVWTEPHAHLLNPDRMGRSILRWRRSPGG